MKMGNPIPGRFEYGGYHDCVAEHTYMIPVTWPAETELLVAAHGVVQTGGLGGLELTLPDQVYVTVVDKPAWDNDGDGYADAWWQIDISQGGILDGSHPAYCADLDTFTEVGEEYWADVYSSYALPEGIVEYPENLDLVNWILNQDFVGEPSPCGGFFNYKNVQGAIWTLIEGYAPGAGCNVAELVDRAYANGEGFEPGCGDLLGVFLIPVTGEQHLLISVPVPCAEDETAWGGDYFGTPLEFPGRNWAIYFEYTVQ
jgi:hypothetical protein